MAKCLFLVKDNTYADNFHRFTHKEMFEYVYVSECERLERDGLTKEEFALFGNNKENIEIFRYLAVNFDMLEPKGRLNGKTGKHKIKAEYVAMFMNWCKPNSKKLFCDWFFSQYKGKYEKIHYSGINDAFNRRICETKDYTVFCKKLDDISTQRSIIDNKMYYNQPTIYPNFTTI